MRILVALSDPKERKSFATALAGDPFMVNEASAVTAPGSFEKIDVAFVELGFVARARQATPRVYVIAVLPATGPSTDFWSAYTAGADDVMRAGASKHEISGRAGALARIYQWTNASKSLTDRVAPLRAWRDVEQTMAGELGALVGESFEVILRDLPASISAASEITLTLASEMIQLRVGLGVDAGAAAGLSRGLLGGDTSLEALTDALREMANTAAGGIKRVALGDNAELTIGLPTNKNVIVNSESAERKAFTLRSATVTLSCVVLVTSSAPKLVLARELREGMVLAREVRNGNGLLIAPAGTSLTRATVEQLARLLGSTSTFEVNEIAA